MTIALSPQTHDCNITSTITWLTHYPQNLVTCWASSLGGLHLLPNPVPYITVAGWVVRKRTLNYGQSSEKLFKVYKSWCRSTIGIKWKQRLNYQTSVLTGKDLLNRSLAKVKGQPHVPLTLNHNNQPKLSWYKLYAELWNIFSECINKVLWWRVEGLVLLEKI